MVWQEGDATKLPFRPETFDLVISRLAIHHYEDPSVRFNDLENRRDSSHTRALTRAQLRESVESAGCRVKHIATRVNVLNAQ